MRVIGLQRAKLTGQTPFDATYVGAYRPTIEMTTYFRFHFRCSHCNENGAIVSGCVTLLQCSGLSHACDFGEASSLQYTRRWGGRDAVYCNMIKIASMT